MVYELLIKYLVANMALKLSRGFALLLVLPLYMCEVTQNEDGTGGKFSFSPPTLNDEEAHSMHVPDSLKCDACTAISIQFTERFRVAHSKRKSLKYLPESELIDMAEEVCYGEALTKYGVKQVKNEKRLSGPGLETEQEPGIMQGGGKWPDRMQRMCNLYVETFEEQGIYDAYLSEDTSVKALLCENQEKPSLAGSCLPAAKTGKKKQKKKKEEL